MAAKRFSAVDPFPGRLDRHRWKNRSGPTDSPFGKPINQRARRPDRLLSVATVQDQHLARHAENLAEFQDESK